MREVIMGYQGEMSLKGLNRNQFESTMMKILRYRLKTVGKFRVYCTQSTFYMEPEEEDIDMDLAFERVSKVFGLAALSRAVVCEKDFDTICQTAEDYLGDSLHGIKTFKVEARRSDKTFPMTSPELMRELGAYLLGRHNYLRVDVKNPQFKVIVEIRDYGAYIHGPKIQGEGGLPVGTSGRALNMLSGGIDSPVAAYRMAKRGLGLDHIHFASPPYTSERAKLKVKALAQLITPYTGSTNLFVVPYTKPQEYIRDNAPDVLFTVLMRRSMMRIANIIARKQGCEALVTGESLAQVASQTVKALQCTDAAQDLPILRPLIGMDKTEIVETARHINTFETSILPYEDCCTIFTPPHPKIRPELSEILEAEAGCPVWQSWKPRPQRPPSASACVSPRRGIRGLSHDSRDHQCGYRAPSRQHPQHQRPVPQPGAGRSGHHGPAGEHHRRQPWPSGRFRQRGQEPLRLAGLYRRPRPHGGRPDQGDCCRLLRG